MNHSTKPMDAKNEIKVLGDGNILLQGIENSPITINTSDNDDILSKLKQLESTQLDALAQMAAKEKDNWGQLFSTLLARQISEKNSVKGNISNVKGNVTIGDYHTNHYYNNKEAKQSKELTPNLPRLRENQIVGRKEDLEDLHKRLFDNKQVVLVNGMGGIGKTTLAQVYLTKYYTEYKYIAWIGLNAEGADFEADFIRTEGLLSRFNINPQGKTAHQSFLELIHALKELKESPCLLIIDNANKDLGQSYNYLPNQPSWHVLATSREQIPHFELKELGFLNETDAVTLFKKHYTRKKLDDAFLVELVSDLEYHTLTIEILAKTAQEQRTALGDLLNAISNNLEVDVDGVRHHGDKIVKLTSYLCSIFETSKLEENEKWLLQQFICLPAELHAYDLLEELITFQENLKFNLSKTLDLLVKKGWLLYNENSDSYKIHRIIIDVIKVSIRLEEKDVGLLLKTISSKLLINQTKDNPIDKFKWMPYGKAILLQFEASSSKKISNLQNNLALVLQYIGDYEGAKVLLEKAKDSDEKNFGERHPITAIRYSNLGLVLQDLGDYKGAKVLLEKAKDLAEKNYGEGHPNTAVRYSNLGLILRELGDYNDAKVLLKKAKGLIEKFFGEGHPTTATSYSNLALVLQDLRDYKGAKILLEKAKNSDEKNFGEEHPSTVVRYSNLGLVLKNLKDYEGAKVLLEKTKALNEKNYGEGHPITATSYSNLGLVLQDLGDYKGAKVLLEKAKNSDEKNFGVEHPTTAIRYSNLGVVLQALKDYKGAKVFLEKAYKVFKNKLGENHRNTKIVKSSLAEITSLTK